MRRDQVIGMVPYDINLFVEEKEMFSEINDVTCGSQVDIIVEQECPKFMKRIFYL